MKKNKHPHDEFLKRTIMAKSNLKDIPYSEDLRAFRVDSELIGERIHLILPFEYEGDLFLGRVFAQGEDGLGEERLEDKIERMIEEERSFIKEFKDGKPIPERVLISQLSRKTLYDDGVILREEGFHARDYIFSRIKGKEKDKEHRMAILKEVLYSKNIAEEVIRRLSEA